MIDYTFTKFLNASLRFLAGRHQFLLNKLSRSSGSERKVTEENKNRILKKMAMWVFGYGSLIWKSGFPYDERVVGFIKDYRRVFYQGSTDHRGTPEYPGRTVTLEPAKGEVCWGAAYKITDKQDQAIALEHLEVREKQYDKKAYVDFFTEASSSIPFISNVMVYIASPDKKLNENYLGPASLEEIAVQIVRAKGPSGPNREYLFKLENALTIIGYEDKHVRELADRVRHILSLQGELVD